MRRYFVTGGTGVVGSALIPLLLEDPADEAWLLIRAADDAELQRRVDALVGFWDLGERADAVRRRLRPLRGDTGLPRLGLAPAEHAELAASVTHIVHAAGAVRMNLPLDAARRSAVGSAEQIAELAWAALRSGQLRKVEFVSTVGVGGRLQRVPEDWIDTPRGFHNTYEQSKAEAEVLIREHQRRGLPLTVHRPSMVVGDSRSGRVVHFQVFYHLCEFLSGRRTLGLFPPLAGATLDIVPSDYVARLIAWSSRADAAALPAVLHSAGGPDRALPLPTLREEVRQRIARRGGRLHPVLSLPRGLIGAAVAVAAAVMPDARARRALRTLPVFLDYLATAQRFDVERTAAVIAAVPGLVAPPDWRDYLPRVLDHYFDSQPRR